MTPSDQNQSRAARPSWSYDPAPRLEGRPQRHLIAFISDCCTIDEKTAVASSALQRAYITWCNKFGLTPMTQTRFGLLLKSIGFDNFRLTRSSRGWSGICLRE
ncbi:primase-like DNA-binding domain-containing protein [Bradyrhizobium barranii]